MMTSIKKHIMNITIMLLVVMLSMAFLGGCWNSTPNTETSNDSEIDLSESGNVYEPGGFNIDDIDIDLTEMSSTMVYSNVNDMMVSPEKYIGDVIKMEGESAMYVDEETGVTYFACIVKDATSCCAQGIEYQLSDEYVYPDDYPKEGDNITVVGEFDIYFEDNYTYCTLRGAKLV